MKTSREKTRLSRSVVEAVRGGKYFGVRAGDAHRFTGVWMVDVDGRVFARSWAMKPHGWRAAFLEDPRGEIEVGDRTLKVRARPVRGERLQDAITQAYFDKYTSKGSLVYSRGFSRGRRRASTMEFLPR